MQDSTKVAQAVAQTLDVLGKKFGATGAHLWGVIIRQVYVDALTDTLQAVVVVLVARWLVQKFLKACHDGEDGMQIVWGSLGFCATIGALICVCEAIAQIGVALNPEFGALRFVLGAIRA